MNWDIRLSDAAGADYDQILVWTLERFGPAQANVYLNRVATALDALKEGPSSPGVRKRDDIGPGLLTLHFGRRARHLIVFRVAPTLLATINVLRILHDGMDVVRHL